MSWQWVWQARCLRVIDGDTLELYLDVGFHDYKVQRIRLAGINCPEAHAPTREAGDRATAFTQAWMEAAASVPTDWPLVITTYKADSFDRYVAFVVATAGGVSLNDALLESGNAVPFMADKTT